MADAETAEIVLVDMAFTGPQLRKLLKESGVEVPKGTQKPAMIKLALEHAHEATMRVIDHLCNAHSK